LILIMLTGQSKDPTLAFMRNQYAWVRLLRNPYHCSQPRIQVCWLCGFETEMPRLQSEWFTPPSTVSFTNIPATNQRVSIQT
jgi:hypothetical protein